MLASVVLHQFVAGLEQWATLCKNVIGAGRLAASSGDKASTELAARHALCDQGPITRAGQTAARVGINTNVVVTASIGANTAAVVSDGVLAATVRALICCEDAFSSFTTNGAPTNWSYRKTVTEVTTFRYKEDRILVREAGEKVFDLRAQASHSWLGQTSSPHSQCFLAVQVPG